MKVGELVAELQTMPQDAEVLIAVDGVADRYDSERDPSPRLRAGVETWVEHGQARDVRVVIL